MDCPYLMDLWDGSPDICQLDSAECLGYCDIAAEIEDVDYLDEETEEL